VPDIQQLFLLALYIFFPIVILQETLSVLFEATVSVLLVHRIENITSNIGKIASPDISVKSYEIMGKCTQ